MWKANSVLFYNDEKIKNELNYFNKHKIIKNTIVFYDYDDELNDKELKKYIRLNNM